MPLPDADAENQGDRQHLAHVYRGILAANQATLPYAMMTNVVFGTPLTYVELMTAPTSVEFSTAITAAEV